MKYTRAYKKGFTIVELLIVIVVIAILASISVTAFTGVQKRANKSAGLAAATAVKDTALAYYASNGDYPTLKSQFLSGGTNSVAKLPNDIVFSSSTLNGSQSAKTVEVIRVIAGSTTMGFWVGYWDPVSNSRVLIDVGTIDTGSITMTQTLPNNT